MARIWTTLLYRGTVSIPFPDGEVLLWTTPIDKLTTILHWEVSCRDGDTGRVALQTDPSSVIGEVAMPATTSIPTATAYQDTHECVNGGLGVSLAAYDGAAGTYRVTVTGWVLPPPS